MFTGSSGDELDNPSTAAVTGAATREDSTETKSTTNQSDSKLISKVRRTNSNYGEDMCITSSQEDEQDLIEEEDEELLEGDEEEEEEESIGRDSEASDSESRNIRRNKSDQVRENNYLS